MEPAPKKLQEENKTQSTKDRQSQAVEIPTRNSTLLCWCSGDGEDSKASIQNYQTREPYAVFPGVQLNLPTAYSTVVHVKEIPGSSFLIVAKYSLNESASFKIVDYSSQKITDVFSFEEVAGWVGNTEVCVNTPRNLMALISLGEKTAYHLFDTNSWSLLRKSPWVPQFGKGNVVTMDISPDGKKIAMVNQKALCVISDINTDNLDVQYTIRSRGVTSKGFPDKVRCRWGEPGGSDLFLAHDSSYLNIFDVEKKNLLLKSSLSLGNHVIWIDKSPSDNNLLALSGCGVVHIFDRREPKATKKFESIYSKRPIYCVRWSPDGKLLATASEDTYAKIFDLRTQKVIFSEQTADEKWALSACFL